MSGADRRFPDLPSAARDERMQPLRGSRRVERAGETRVAREVAGSVPPGGRALGQLVRQQRILVGSRFPKRAHCVRRADDSMGGTGGRAWQQTRPPAQQQVAPGQLLGFPGRQSNPITDQALMAEVVAPVVGGDAPDLGRLSQTDAIPIRRHARRTQCPVPGFGGWATTDHGVARPRGILVPVDDTASRRRRRPPRLARPTRTGSGPSALGQAGDRLARWAGPRKRRGTPWHM